MLTLLVEFADEVSVFNVFRYITFRTGGALITSALIVFIFGPTIIASLRVRQGKGQPIRADGPQTHFKKAGTPTMGGLMILSGIVGSSLLWANISSVYVWAASYRRRSRNAPPRRCPRSAARRQCVGRIVPRRPACSG